MDVGVLARLVEIHPGLSPRTLPRLLQSPGQSTSKT